ncbi:MAG: flagellar motor switch protein FliG [Oscillospiraceae bacterium]|nr:flagellar motor switch protein FliG [Oscillospiraceae bacterium]
MARGGLTGRDKAAILLITLGKDYSAQLYKHLTEEEISQMTISISTTRRVTPEVKEQIVDEFYEICLAQKFITEGGIDYARDILEQAVGKEKATALISKLSTSIQARPFDFIRHADSANILSLIHNEHPQTIALVMSYISARQAADVLTAFPQDKQTEIIARIGKMGDTAPEFVQEAERILERKVSSMGYSDRIAVGGIDTIVGIVNSLDRGSEKRLLEELEIKDPDFTEEIRRHLFVFEDIAKLNNQAVQRILRDVDNNDLAIALKLATDDVSKIIFSNVSKRLADMIKDDMEVMGPVRVKDIEDAQQRIVAVIRKLDDDHEIVISRGEGDDMIV